MHKNIVTYEHKVLKFTGEGKQLTKEQFAALEKYHGDKCNYFTLVHNGVKFNQYVGVIQVGKTTIEVLPKIDNIVLANAEMQSNPWRTMLIDMMRAVANFDTKVTSQSQLKIKPNAILDVYFYMYLEQINYLLYTGLVKKYKSTEGNLTALKGSLHFAKHLQHNVVHQELFYTRHTTYTVEHILHQILYKALLLIQSTSSNTAIQAQVARMLLRFPPMNHIKVTATTFTTIILNRKTEHYKQALDIAKLLLLNYHPNVVQGNNDVLALMFDMNVLWEQFVYVSIKKHSKEKITKQTTKNFWQSATQKTITVTIKPDIIVQYNNGEKIVLDTKWKNLDLYKPAVEDLRQMYVYQDYFNANKVALLYPGKSANFRTGNYYNTAANTLSNKECSLLPLAINTNIKDWQIGIANFITNWAIATI